MISYRDIRKVRWDALIMFLAIYNGFYIPFDFAFKPEISQRLGFQMLTILIDIIFIVDLVLGFFTSYLDNKGKECFDSN